MTTISLSKTQSKAIAHAVYDDIKRYAEDNFERFILSYWDELRNSNGTPLEPITLRFEPCTPFRISFSTENTIADVERGERK
jgi:hypothetical protein